MADKTLSPNERKAIHRRAIESICAHWSWPFFNSGLFAWCLTLIVVTVGGSYFSSRSQCRTDAELLIDKYDKTVAELRYRLIRLNQTAKTSTSIDSLRQVVTSLPLSSSELNTLSYTSLMYRIRRLRQGIEYTGDSYDCTDSVCGSIYVLERLDDLNDQVELSNILESISAWGTPEYILMHELYSEPSCSSAGIIRLMLGLPHQIAIGRTPAGGN